MRNFFSRFSEFSIEKGCGLTLDLHRSKEFDVIQFLWATPLEASTHKNLEELENEIFEAAKKSGLILEAVDPYVTNLPNESGVLEICPFQPDNCPGKHFVITGSGRAF